MSALFFERLVAVTVKERKRTGDGRKVLVVVNGLLGILLREDRLLLTVLVCMGRRIGALLEVSLRLGLDRLRLLVTGPAGDGPRGRSVTGSFRNDSPLHQGIP